MWLLIASSLFPDFIMVVVWRNVYKHLGVMIFLKNRAIRLFPSYLVALILVISIEAIALLGGFLPSHTVPAAVAGYLSGSYSLVELAAATFANIFIVGQDAVIFADRSYNLHRLIFMVQAWSVALEIYFYLTVPWLARRWTNAAAVLVVSACLRYWLYHYGFSGADWYNKFAPFAIYLFALGALSGHAYLRWQHVIPAWTGRLGVAIFALITIVFWPLFEWWPVWGFGPYFSPPAFVIAALVTAIVLPFTFKTFRSSKIDMYFGEYSYPLYLVHVIVAVIGLSHSMHGVVLVGGLSVFLVHVVEPFSEKWRRSNAPMGQPVLGKPSSDK